MAFRDAPNGTSRQTAREGFGHAPPIGSLRRMILAAGGCLVALGLAGLLSWVTGRLPLTVIFPQYTPIALYAAAFFVVTGCILLWHANRVWSSAAFSIAMAASIITSLVGLLGVLSYLMGVELTLESVIVPRGLLLNGLPAGHLSPAGAILFMLVAPAVWLGMHPLAGSRSRQMAAILGLIIAASGGTMTIGYLLGVPLLYGGNVVPVAAPAALGFVFLGSGLVAAAGNDLVPLRYLAGDSLRARLLRRFLPLATGLAVLQETAQAALLADASNPALVTSAWTIFFLVLSGTVVVFAARALGKEYDDAQAERRRAEESLRESENRLRFAMEGANDGLWDVQMKTGAVYLSPRGCEILGYRPEEMEQVAKVWNDLVHPGDMAETTRQLNAHLEGRSPLFAVEQRLLTKSGEWKWVLARGKVVERDAGGAPLRMTGTHTDITSQRQASEALRWDLALEAALAALYPPLISAATNPAEMASFVLEQARALTGSEHGYVSAVDPVTGEGLVHSFTQMTATGCRVTEQGGSFKLRPGEDGKYPALWGEALNTRRPFFTNTPQTHATARGLPGGHVPLLKFLSVPVLLGSELVGQIALANPGRDYTDRDLQAVQRMGEFYALAIQTQRARTEILELNASLEQRVRERTQELEASNRELEAFSYSVSHDLRAPLRGIDGWGLALLEDYGSSLDEQAKVYLGRVRSETQRMGQLIDDLLVLSRITRADMQRQPVDLSALASGIAERLTSSEPNRAVDWIIQPDLTAEGDPRLLEIALENLLANAWKFTSKRDRAHITVGRAPRPETSAGAPDETAGPDSGSVFFVRDDGTGFNMAYAHRLFSPFQRLHKASEFPGTGIGLATTARVIRRHGGRIWAEAGPDQGATFYFTIQEAHGYETSSAG